MVDNYYFNSNEKELLLMLSTDVVIQWPTLVANTIAKDALKNILSFQKKLLYAMTMYAAIQTWGSILMAIYF